eukprot:349500-Rhodomonas_salina.1
MEILKAGDYTFKATTSSPATFRLSGNLVIVATGPGDAEAHVKLDSGYHRIVAIWKAPSESDRLVAMCKAPSRQYCSWYSNLVAIWKATTSTRTCNCKQYSVGVSICSSGYLSHRRLLVSTTAVK